MDPNLLDALLAVVLVIAAAGGVRVGLVGRVAGVVGIVGGTLLATLTVPWVRSLLPLASPGARTTIGIAALGMTVSLTSALAHVVGTAVRRAIVRGPLTGPDRALGALASVVAVGVTTWLVAPTAADVPGAVARQVRGSVLVGLLDAATPTPPDATLGLRAILGDDRSPVVFATLAPAPDTGPPPPASSVASAVVDRAAASTVNVEMRGCGGITEGSGVTLGPATVVTNAHVVAGAEVVEVRLPDGTTRRATVVVLDVVRDLAVLIVDDHPQVPLPLAAAVVGSEAVVIGHPGGQDLARVAPVRIDRRTRAIGRDVGGTETAARDVLFLAAALRQGDSGAPVVDAVGAVVGIVFAISPDDPTTAYALDVEEVRAALAAPRRPGVVGTCP